MFSARSHVLVRTVFATHNSQRHKEAGLLVAGFCTSAAGTNYYDSLGIPKSSTQTDIKAAYYKLSMQFHPDKNRGSELAAKKFREITQAYEVLGNYRLRRLYDKGAIHTAGPQYARSADAMHDHHTEEVPDDPETKFYKSRFKKSTVADSTGRTPIYNFDEWSRAHYGQSFKRRQEAKEKWDKQQSRKHSHAMSIQNEIIIFGFIFCFLVVYLMFIVDSYDTPKAKAERAAANNTKVEKESS